MPISLFPFNTPYGDIYTGSCDDADPLAVVGPNYFSTYQGPFAAKPGQSGSVKLHQPPVPIQIDRSARRLARARSSGPGARATRAAAPRSSCSAPRRRRPGRAARPVGSAGPPARYDPGLPYGTYTICAKTTTGGGARWVQGSVTLNDPTRGRASGTTTLNATASSNPDTTTCPA